MHEIASYLVHLLSAVRVGPTAKQQDGRGGVCWARVGACELSLTFFAELSWACRLGCCSVVGQTQVTQPTEPISVVKTTHSDYKTVIHY
jgi:hypothetical protein